MYHQARFTKLVCERVHIIHYADDGAGWELAENSSVEIGHSVEYFIACHSLN